MQQEEVGVHVCAVAEEEREGGRALLTAAIYDDDGAVVVASAGLGCVLYTLYEASLGDGDD